MDTFTQAFDACRTIREVDARYRELFTEYMATDMVVFTPLSEAHRKALIRLTHDAEQDAKPHDPNRVRPHDLRNWCRVEGIGLAKRGRVSVEIENRYREAHGMELLPVKEKSQPREKKEAGPKLNADGLDTKAIREWARAQGMTVGTRGRLHPDVLAKYRAEAGV